MKECRNCGQIKSFAEYHANKETRDGCSSYCKGCATERSKVWKSKNKDRAKNTDLQAKYGISFIEHAAIFIEQKGCCAICGIKEKDATRKILFVDHDHKTGKVRGLLCHHCNSGLGYFMDNPENLSKAEVYLMKQERVKSND